MTYQVVRIAVRIRFHNYDRKSDVESVMFPSV